MTFNKKILYTMLATIILSVSPTKSYAADTKDLDAKLAGQHLAVMMEYIDKNYVGEDLTIEQLYDAALKGIAEEMDEYSTYFTEDELEPFLDSILGHKLRIGIVMEKQENGDLLIKEVLKDSPAEDAGLLINDKILKINNKSVVGLTMEQVNAVIAEITSNTMNIDITRKDEIKALSIPMVKISDKSVYVSKLDNLLEIDQSRDNNKIRYMYISAIQEATPGELKEAINTMKNEGVTNIILDLRGNPGGLLDETVTICNELVPKGPIYYAIDKNGKKYVENSELETSPFKNIIVLTNKSTASAAELITAALQDAKSAIVVGDTTYGKGVVQGSRQTLTNGLFKFTYLEYFRRSGEKVNKIGVAPDVKVDVPDLISEELINNESYAGEEISNLKKVLKYLNYEDLDTNPTYDAKTKEVIIKFQKQQGILANGQLDKDTILKLNTAYYNKYQEEDIVLGKAYELLKDK